MASLIERAKRLIMAPRKVAELQEKVAHLESRAKFGKGGTASGVDISWGKFGYEDNPDFDGVTRWATIEEMEADPHVKGALRQATLPLINAEWKYEPGDETPLAQDIADFCNANLLRQSNDSYGNEYWIQTPWNGQRLREILRCLNGGWSMFVSSYRAVGTKRVFDRLQWIEPLTLSQTQRPWNLDEYDNIVSVERQYETPSGRFVTGELIEADRLHLYSWDIIGARYEGRPFLRSLYGAWKRKSWFLKWASLWAQKQGAPMPVVQYPANADASQVQRFIQAARAMRGESPDFGYYVGPMDSEGKGAEFGYATSDSKDLDHMRGLINGENSEMAHGGGTKAGMLGEQESGSRALGESQGMVDMEGPETIATVLCEQEMHGVANLSGPVETLVRLNYGPDAPHPKLTVSKINPFEDFQHIPQIIEAKNAGIIPDHPAFRRQMTERFGIELPDEAYEIVEDPDKENEAVPGQDALADPDSPPTDEGNDTPEAGDTPSMSLEATRERIANLLKPVEETPPKGGRFRGRTVLEAEYVNLAEVSEAFRVGERDIKTQLRQIEVGMKADLMKRLRAGKVTTRNLDGLRRSKFRGQKKAEAALVTEFKAVGDLGIKHAGDELSRQQG